VTLPSTMTHDAKTSAPEAFNVGRGSPVTEISFTEAEPSTMTPSQGIAQPAATRTRAPTFRDDDGTSMGPEGERMVAVSGRDLEPTAERECAVTARALDSMVLPIETKNIRSTGVSKKSGIGGQPNWMAAKRYTTSHMFKRQRTGKHQKRIEVGQAAGAGDQQLHVAHACLHGTERTTSHREKT
jgi:hypothetical protein